MPISGNALTRRFLRHRHIRTGRGVTYSSSSLIRCLAIPDIQGRGAKKPHVFGVFIIIPIQTVCEATVDDKEHDVKSISRNAETDQTNQRHCTDPGNGCNRYYCNPHNKSIQQWSKRDSGGLYASLWFRL